MGKFRAVSLFSNCGAGDVGYRNAGFRFDVMAELDPRRLDVCLLNHPGAEGVVGDLRKTWRQVIHAYRSKAGNARPALLCACPPCQGMSSAKSGKGSHDDAEAGSKDKRNLLVTVIAKVALELMPSIIVIENVPAFLTRKVIHPKDKRPVSAANFLITALRKKYTAFPMIADLCDFGIPQSRNRSFITFVRNDVPGLVKLIQLGRAPFPRPTHSGDMGANVPITLSSALKTFKLPSLDAASEGSAAADGYAGLHSVPVWDKRIYTMVAAIPPGSGKSAWENSSCGRCGAVQVTENDVLCPKCSDPLLKPVVKNSDGSFRLVKGFKSSYRRMHLNRPAATVTTASGHVGSDYTIHPTQNRVLSPLECAMLQTFPGDFNWGNALNEVGSTNIRGMIGEAVPPAFTKMHGDVLAGILRREWVLAPISDSDDRCEKAWKKLSAAAIKDGRTNPLSYRPKPKEPDNVHGESCTPRPGKTLTLRI